jgi:arylsulfatase A-like enzyme
MGAYGERLIETPNIDKLAKNGVLYTNAFMPSPVCSASRSTIITGVMATTLGLHNHHSSRTPESEIKLPKEFKTIQKFLKNQVTSHSIMGKMIIILAIIEIIFTVKNIRYILYMVN